MMESSFFFFFFVAHLAGVVFLLAQLAYQVIAVATTVLSFVVNLWMELEILLVGCPWLYF